MRMMRHRIPKLAGMAAVMRGIAISRFLTEANSSTVTRNTYTLMSCLPEDGDKNLDESQKQNPAHTTEENLGQR